jgi:hypothetical protein
MRPLNQLLQLLPERWMYASFPIGFVILAFTAHPTLGDFALCRGVERFPVLNAIDPTLLHILGALQLTVILALLFNRALSQRMAPPFRWTLSYPAAAIIALSGGITSLLLSRMLKAAFNAPRPCPTTVDSVFSAWLRDFTGLSDIDTGGTPSGFVLRQLWLAFVVIWCLEQPIFRDRNGILSRRARISHRTFALLLVIGVGAGRVLMGSHTAIDVGIAIALGTLCFWASALIIYAMSDKKYKSRLSDIAFLAVIYLPLFFLYSTDSRWWGWVVLISFPLLAGLKFLEHSPIHYIRQLARHIAVEREADSPDGSTH